MSKITPYYSDKGKVHHDHKDCTRGNNIEKENFKNGTGNRKKCKECLNKGKRIKK